MELHAALAPPYWNEGQEQRLTVSLLLAAVIVASILSLLRLPAIGEWRPVERLFVTIAKDAGHDPKPVEPATSATGDSEAAPAPRHVDQSESSSARPGTGPAVVSRSPQDRRAASEAAIRRYLDRPETPYAVNPGLEEKRREFRGRYQAPTREAPRPIWENAEKDTLGRTVLRSGDCYRVIDDPNVGSREVFELFGQYIVVCASWDPAPRQLPWVAGVRNRYSYLRSPDGYAFADGDR